jgi:hypothetical protein
MNSQITGLRVASVVFGLMAIAQLARLVMRPEVFVAGHRMPLWPSAGLHHFERFECLDVETRSHADQMNEPGTNTPDGPMQRTERPSAAADRQAVGHHLRRMALRVPPADGSQ